jgi:HAD superfamily hydrolase (TIGR01509 family)
VQPDLLIFDFDGVIADSETLSNALLAETMTKFHVPMSTADAMRRYMGRRWSDNLVRITEDFGGTLPVTFEETLKSVTRARMRADVMPVVGVAEFLDVHAEIPKCVASSSSPEWLSDMTRKFDFTVHFRDRLFSATAVRYGKPAPDIFLHAARGMDIVASRRCIVIEDSPAGVEGAIAAGMTTIGFCGASHIPLGHDEKLKAAGAHAIAYGWNEVGRLISMLDYDTKNN